MAADFKCIVVGRGMMGAAAARHLARQTDGVALIGPDEPDRKHDHAGVFASHYDEGRITRTIDPDPVWAQLANHSIGRYAGIADASGIDFYTEAGCLLAGPARGGADRYVADVCAAAGRLGVATDILDDAALRHRFGCFTFPAGSEGVFEAGNAGHISPRRLVAAQTRLAARAGAAILADTVVSVRDSGGVATVTTVAGHRYTADRVLVAAGGFSIAAALLPDPLELAVFARTVAFFEVDAAEAARLRAMPSLITQPAVERDSIYMLPPILYPDGRFYLKIGGDPDDLQLDSDADIRAWFRGTGRDSTRDHLVRVMGTLVPDLAVRAITTASCVTTFTPTGYPAIGYTASPRIAVATGGCGKAAKSSDEIGRLGARLLLDGQIDDPAYETGFPVSFRVR